MYFIAVLFALFLTFLFYKVRKLESGNVHSGWQKKWVRVTFASLLIFYWIIIIIAGLAILNTDTPKENKQSSPQTEKPQTPFTKWEQWKETNRVSDYDNECHRLSSAFQTVLNDPESFEHVETVYKPNKDTSLVVVTMTYRAKNGFGAKMLGRVRATIDGSGRITDIKELK